MSYQRAPRRSKAQAPTIAHFILSLALVCAPCAAPPQQVSGQTRQAAPRTAQSFDARTRPRLVLLIVVDQFRYDYLERFGDLFTPNGIGRLVREGASWTEANYDHVPTYTAPGHATMMTGAWPAETGIVANDWPDRETGKKLTSVSDETTRLLGGAQGAAGSSPRRLMASTLGDELRLATHDRSKVVGVSLKDRAAILPAGRHASAAYWFSTGTGTMVSSDYYFDRLPDWVTKFNAARPANKLFGARWERLLPEAEYVRRAGADAPEWEDVSRVKDTNTFPHVVTGGAKSPDKDFYEALDYSPFSNEMLLNFTEEAIVSERLGADDDTDVLAVSFSANDYVGHRFGPYSQEAMDMTLRVDRQVGALLDFVGARVGLQNTLVVFTADHGMAPMPKHAASLGLPGAYVPPGAVLSAMRLGIAAHFKRTGGAKVMTDDYVIKYRDGDSELDGFINGNLYLNRAALARDGVESAEVERAACDAALAVPGVSRCFTRARLQEGSVPDADPVARRVLHGFYARRSGDVIIVYDPFKYKLSAKNEADHGSPYGYDTHVPLIIMGRGFAPGRYEQAAMPSDLAPTLAAYLRVQAPSNSVGRVLTEGFAPAPRRSTAATR